MKIQFTKREGGPERAISEAEIVFTSSPRRRSCSGSCGGRSKGADARSGSSSPGTGRSATW